MSKTSQSAHAPSERSTDPADYQREIPHNTLLELDHMGHLPQEESPQRALPAVEQFLMEPFHG